jgi:structural maintenance of chromosome 4
LTEKANAIEHELTKAQREMRLIQDQEERFSLAMETVQAEITDTKKESGGIRREINAIMSRFDKLGIPVEQMDQSEELTIQDLSVIELFDQKNEGYQKNIDDGFRIVNTKVKETYQLLTLGGDAELRYVDKGDPWNRGIRFSVRPPGRRWKGIGNLSGAENREGGSRL